MSQIPIEKEVFNKNTYNKVIDNQFKQLINNTPDVELPVFTIEDFFQLYEQLFYQIPKDGEVNSHSYIIQKEADYLGIIISQDDIQALLDEITILRQEVLESQTTINELNKLIKQ
mgnify:FL=1